MTGIAVKIEKGIPIPKDGRGRKDMWGEIASQLEVGDSIFFALEDVRKFNTARNMLARRGVKVTTRRVEDGFRIWCVEKSMGESA